MVYLIGAGGHAKVIIEILEKQGLYIGGLQDGNPKVKSLLGHDVHHEFPEFFHADDAEVIISIGNNAIRKKLADSSNYKYVSAIHPSANISKRATIGKGTVIMAGVSINADVEIGKHAIINTNASVDHECILEDYVHISPNAALGGNVHVGEGTHIGIGANVIQGIKIGKWCTVGAGTVVLNDIPDGSTVVGNPGKVIKSK